MILNKKLLYTTGLLSIAYASFISCGYADMNMRKALELTANTNPQIRADESSALAREKVIRQAEAGYLPKVDVSMSAGPERTREKINPNPASGALDFGATEYRRNPAVNASQMVFDGWKTRSDVDRATTDYIQGTKKTDETNEQISYRAAAAYIKVRRFQRLRREAERNLQAHKNIAGTVEQLIKGGRASTADRATVAARIATATNAVTDIQGDLDDATAEFKALVGVEPDRLVSAKIPDTYLPACVNDAIMAARERNKSVILSRASLDVALAESNVVEAPFYPRVTVEANASRAKNNAGEKGRIDIFNVLGVVRYNLYNGGADMAKVAEISEKIAQQRYLVDQQLRVSEEEVRRSWAQRVSSRENAIQQRKAVVALREEKDAFAKQYELGTRTLVDVLGAINEYFLARGALITSDAAQDTSEARLLASMGMLTESFGTNRLSPGLYEDKGVKKPPSDYDPHHCKVKGGLPQAEIVSLPVKESVLEKPMAHTVSAKEESGFFGGWLNDLNSSEPAQNPAPRPVAAVQNKNAAQEDEGFFSGFMTNLASTEPTSSKDSKDNSRPVAEPTQRAADSKEDESFFSGFLFNLSDVSNSNSQPTASTTEQSTSPTQAPTRPEGHASKSKAVQAKQVKGKKAPARAQKQATVKATDAAYKAQPKVAAPAPVAQSNNDETSGNWFSSVFDGN